MPVSRWGAVVAVVAIASCSSPSKSTSVRGASDDGGEGAATLGDASQPDAAPTTPSGAAAPYVVAPQKPDGSLAEAGGFRVRVQWKNAPAALRRSVGRTACGTQADAPLSVHTLHGVEHAVVMLIGVTRGVAPPAISTVQVEIDGCRAIPATSIVARNDLKLEVVSRDERRHQVRLSQVGGALDEVSPAAALRLLAEFELPLVGASAAVDPGGAGVFRLDLLSANAPPAWFVIANHPYVAVTDDVGAASFSEVPPGDYGVIIWHRPLAPDKPALRYEAPVTIKADETASLVIDLDQAVKP